MEQFIQKYPYNQLFENNADSHFYMKIGGTVYDVIFHESWKNKTEIRMGGLRGTGGFLFFLP